MENEERAPSLTSSQNPIFEETEVTMNKKMGIEANKKVSFLKSKLKIIKNGLKEERMKNSNLEKDLQVQKMLYSKLEENFNEKEALCIKLYKEKEELEEDLILEKAKTSVKIQPQNPTNSTNSP